MIFKVFILSIILLAISFTGCAKKPCIPTMYEINSLKVVGSFKSDEKFKIINITTTKKVQPLDDFLLITDRNRLYIIEIESGKQVASLSNKGLLDLIKVSSSKYKKPVITYTYTSLPSEGDAEFNPGPPEEYKLIFSNGIFQSIQ